MTPQPTKAVQSVCLNREKFLQEQKVDPTLAAAWMLSTDSTNREFRVTDGLLFRISQNGTEQLCIPTSYRTEILRTAHRNPWAGHLGRRKTGLRVLGRFFWPKVYQDIKEHRRGCPECQYAAKHRKHRAPLMPLPVISTPFQRVAIDIVGPMPKTRRGHLYLLTFMDYATRYPEAIPLRSVTSKDVAEALTSTFARLVSYSQIMGRITHIGDAQTDGMLERFHATLKAMIKKIKHQFQDQWDLAVPTALFAYREIPHESTAFQLLYVTPSERTFGSDARSLGINRTPKAGDNEVSHRTS